MIANYGKFLIEPTDNGSVYLDYAFSGRHNSVVSLEIIANDSSFITNVANAKITDI